MLRVIAAALAVLALASCGSDGSEEPEQASADLWDQSFVSTAIIENGEPLSLIGDARVRVTFEDREDQGVVRWRAECNTHGGIVEITPERLGLDMISGTQVGCSDDLHAQDEWLVDFFAANPQWQLSDEELTLISGDAVIELEAPGGEIAGDGASERLSAYGVTIDVPNGWEGRVSWQDDPDALPVMQLASFPLNDDQGFTSAAPESMPEGGLWVALVEHPREETETKLFRGDRPSALTWDELDTSTVNPQVPRQLGFQEFFAASKRAFMLYVVASEPQDRVPLDQLNEAMESLEIEAVRGEKYDDTIPTDIRTAVPRPPRPDELD